MALHGMIFDVDGTLVDTNPAHVDAWRRAFKRLGYDVAARRIKVEIGKGGDLLVPSILGEEVERRHGDALRKAQKEEFLNIARRERFRVFPCVPELFQALRQRGMRTALATSSNKKHLQAVCDSAATDLPGLADVLVTTEEAKPASPRLIWSLSPGRSWLSPPPSAPWWAIPSTTRRRAGERGSCFWGCCLEVRPQICF